MKAVKAVKANVPLVSLGRIADLMHIVHISVLQLIHRVSPENSRPFVSKKMSPLSVKLAFSANVGTCV